MHPQLEAVDGELRAATERARRLLSGRDPALLSRSPAAGAWSAVQCLAHLNITTEVYLPILAGALERAPAAAGEPHFGIGLLPRLLLWSLEPPYRQRTRTIPTWEPGQPQAPRAVLGTFEELQGRLSEVLRRFDGRALDQVLLESPFDKRLKYNVYAAFRILAAHQRRHLWQAERAATD
jgi:hypothetical protein